MVMLFVILAVSLLTIDSIRYDEKKSLLMMVGALLPLIYFVFFLVD